MILVVFSMIIIKFVVLVQFLSVLQMDGDRGDPLADRKRSPAVRKVVRLHRKDQRHKQNPNRLDKNTCDVTKRNAHTGVTIEN